MKRAVLILLVGCGADSFYFVPSLEADAADGGQGLPDSARVDGGGQSDADPVDASQGVDVVPAKDGAAADTGACPMPSPTIGGACSPPGLRACRSISIAWYCSGTWTSDVCSAQNPSCSPCDAGYCCTIGPVCP